jgi:signal transduction histidine kinase
MTLERRVSAALVSLVTLFVATQGAIAYLSLAEQEDRIADELLLAEARQLAFYAQRGDLDGPRARDLLDRGGDLEAWLLRHDGQVVPPTLPDELGALDDGPHLSRHGGRHRHVLVAATPAGRLIVSYDAARNETRVEQYGLFLLGLGLLCIGAAWLVARRLARIVVAPMQRLADRLSGWVPGARHDANGRTDEETRLLAAFSRVQGRFEDAIAREREFAANLSHELRAPLAALRSDLEMLAETPSLGAPQRARIERAVATVDVLAGSIGSARALSHRAPVAGVPVALAGCIDDAWAIVRDGDGGRGLRVENAVPPRAIRHADRHALLTILRNLLANAAEHAAPARCTVSGDAAALRIEDDGPGVTADALPLLFERSWRGARADTGAPGDSQRGLGLAIARELAELNGWTLSAALRPKGGLVFTLAFEPGEPSAVAEPGARPDRRATARHP